jgi:hypothetical protein
MLAFPWPRTFAIWFEQWRAPSDRLQSIESTLRTEGLCVFRGGDFDRWDLEVRGSMLGAARLRTAVEEHGLGRQLVRFRVWPRASTTGVMVAASFASLAAAAAHDRAWAGATILLFVVVLLCGGIVEQCAAATAALLGPVLVQERAARLTASRAPASPAFAVERRVKRTTAADRRVAAIEQAFGS